MVIGDIEKKKIKYDSVNSKGIKFSIFKPVDIDENLIPILGCYLVLATSQRNHLLD